MNQRRVSYLESRLDFFIGYHWANQAVLFSWPYRQVVKVKNLASGYNQVFSPLLCSLGGSDQGSFGCHPGTLEHFTILDH